MVEWLGVTVYVASEVEEDGDGFGVSEATAVYCDEDGVHTVTLGPEDKSDDGRFSYDTVGVASDYRDRQNYLLVEAREDDDGRFLWRTREPADDEFGRQTDGN